MVYSRLRKFETALSVSHWSLLECNWIWVREAQIASSIFTCSSSLTYSSLDKASNRSYMRDIWASIYTLSGWSYYKAKSTTFSLRFLGSRLSCILLTLIIAFYCHLASSLKYPFDFFMVASNFFSSWVDEHWSNCIPTLSGSLDLFLRIGLSLSVRHRLLILFSSRTLISWNIFC